MTTLKFATVAASVLLAVAPAFAGEFEDQYAAINAAAAGRWTGTVQSIDPGTGVATPVPYDFTMVITSEDGLNYAYWSPEGLTMIDYLGDGAIRSRTWSEAGVLSESRDAAVSIPEGTPEGTSAWVVQGGATGPDGNPYDTFSSYAVSDGALTYTAEAMLRGSDGPRITTATGSWTRPQ